MDARVAAGGDGLDLQRASQSDEQLAALVALRDVGAVAALYDRYARSIYTLAARMLGAAEAEEVVQDVFLRLWNKAAQFDRERGTFRSWFMAVARNQVLDRLRHRSEQRRLLVADEVERLLAQAVDPGVDVEEEVWRREQAESVSRALRELPQEQRRVLVLAYFGGFSQSEIARLLACPLGTVKKRTHLGMQKLRATLLHEGILAEAIATAKITPEE